MKPGYKFFFRLLTLFYSIVEGFVLLFVPKKLLFKTVNQEIVLITGGGSGIGRQMALQFAHLEAIVVVWDVDNEGLSETCLMIKEMGGSVKGYLVDVTDRQAVYDTAKLIKKEVGKVDILVNNAGIVNGQYILDLADDDIEKIFRVNTISHFWTCKAFLPAMMDENHGHVVNVASMGGHVTTDKLTDYCATKFSVVGFTEALTTELRNGGYFGITVTMVCPGPVNTGAFTGVKGGLLPVMEPNVAAKKIVEAVLMDQKVVMVPWFLWLVMPLKWVLPVDGFAALCDLLGSSDSMKNFRGRGQPASGVKEAQRGLEKCQ